MRRETTKMRPSSSSSPASRRSSSSAAAGLWAALAVLLLAVTIRTSMVVVPLSSSSSKLLSSFQGLRSQQRASPSASGGEELELYSLQQQQPLLPPLPPHTTWGDVSGEYIVRFREYAPAREHERALEAAMPGAIESVVGGGRRSRRRESRVGGGGVGSFLASLLRRGASSSSSSSSSSSLPPSWRWVPRDNPAAAFPTDFGVLRLGEGGSASFAAASAASAASAAAAPSPPTSSSPPSLSPSPAEVLAALRSLPFVRDVHAQRKLTRALAWVDAANKGEGEEEGEEKKEGEEKENASASASSASSASSSSSNKDKRLSAFSALSSLFDAGGGKILKRPGRLTTRPTIGLFSDDEPSKTPAAASSSSSSSTLRRSLRDSTTTTTTTPTAPPSVAAESGAPALWKLGHFGAGVRVGVFDTSVRADHPDIAHVDERSNWTHEPTLDDGLGHGSFVAGVVAAGGRDVLNKPSTQCPGLAPLARIHTFRVFTNDQVSFTSWFLDAFNYAMATKMHIVNLSIGGPDWLDAPFVDKVAEVTASGIVMVSAIGNDGPNYGTCNNPADQADVIGVGGIGYDNAIAAFSSRGATTWEAPRGAGRVKPDVVAFGRDVSGARIDGGCRQLSGTSVASPVVAGAAALLASTLPADAPRFHVDGWRPAAARDGVGLGANRSFSAIFSDEDFPAAGGDASASSPSIGVINPASMKQALIEGADRLPNVRAAEQGAGKINLSKSAAVLKSYRPRASAFPAALNLTDCPYLWPHCEQPLFARGAPLMLNVTLLNGMGPTGRVVGSPTFTLVKEQQQGDGGSGKNPPPPPPGLLEVRFEHSERLYPWSGFLAVYVHVVDSPAARSFDGVVRGEIEVTVASPRAMVGDGDRRKSSKKGSTTSSETGGNEDADEDEVTSTVTIPLVARVVPTPPRAKRLLWDQRHSVRYPPSYLPRDSLSVKHDVLDWHGDHLHTNYHTLFTFLRSKGYFVDILGSTFDCFSAEDYGALLVVDAEEEYYAAEVEKISRDVKEKGLGLVAFADWFNVAHMASLRFFDDNTRSWWTPPTGGANVPALNDLLAPFGIAFGDAVLEGPVGGVFVGEAPIAAGSTTTKNGAKSYDYASGANIARFPAGGTLFEARLTQRASEGVAAAPVDGGKDAQEATDGEGGLTGRHAILGLAPRVGAGAVAAYGDSGCLDSSHQRGDCFWLLEKILEFAVSRGAARDPALFGPADDDEADSGGGALAAPFALQAAGNGNAAGDSPLPSRPLGLPEEEALPFSSVRDRNAAPPACEPNSALQFAGAHWPAVAREKKKKEKAEKEKAEGGASGGGAAAAAAAAKPSRKNLLPPKGGKEDAAPNDAAAALYQKDAAVAAAAVDDAGSAASPLHTNSSGRNGKSHESSSSSSSSSSSTHRQRSPPTSTSTSSSSSSSSTSYPAASYYSSAALNAKRLVRSAGRSSSSAAGAFSPVALAGAGAAAALCVWAAMRAKRRRRAAAAAAGGGDNGSSSNNGGKQRYSRVSAPLSPGSLADYGVELGNALRRPGALTSSNSRSAAHLKE